jgi:hypothetical protein
MMNALIMSNVPLYTLARLNLGSQLFGLAPPLLPLYLVRGSAILRCEKVIA